MKDQYFGDARDYFKYHLLEELVRNVPGLGRLLCVWMLTPPDKSREGNVMFVENLELPTLTSFLRRHLELGDRRISHLRGYFRERSIDYIPWGDEPPYFYEKRQDYFATIPAEHLRHALVFFDPDVGLKHERPTKKHLSFDELASVHERMDAQSIAVVFQYWVRRRGFWRARADEIAARLGSSVAYVADPSVAFYVMPKSGAQVDPIKQTLRSVASGHPSRIVRLVDGYSEDSLA